MTHGAYASLALAPRAAELEEAIRAVVPAGSPADELAIQGLALVAARVEAAGRALSEVDDRAEHPLSAYLGADGGQTFDRLRNDLARWIHLSLRYCDALGLTPTSRAKLGLDLVRGANPMEPKVNVERLSDDQRSQLLDLLEEAAS